MANFNTMQALPSGATPGPDGLGLTGGNQGLGMDGFDQDLNFDESLLDSVNGGLPALSFTPSYDFDTFSTTFEDPFSYPGVRPYDNVVSGTENYNDEVSSPQELDNKLLGFSPPITKTALVGDDVLGTHYGEPGMTAELYGMFFVAEDVFGTDSNPARPLELTCYRRNLWQCSGQITVPRNLTAVANEQGHHVPIFDLAASITAIESIEGRPTEIISIPWKSGNANQALGLGEETKVAGTPPTLLLDLTSGQELDGNRVTVPVSWKRLQFKHATANNGRRKGLQQHYVVQINLLGKTKNGDFIEIAEIQSGPVIVRGRSPRNFDSKKDVPLTSDKRPDRRGPDAAPSSSSSAAALGHGFKVDKGDLSHNLQRYHSLGNIQPGDWPAPQQAAFHQQSPHPSKKLALSPGLVRPPVPAWSGDPQTQQQQQQQLHQPTTPSFPKHSHSSSSSSAPTNAQRLCGASTLPINLSLSEDERSPKRPNIDPVKSPEVSKSGHQASQSSQLAGASAATETADMLYEYFPLSLDDWMPPVDAVYRPHVVHHTILPPEMKAQQTRSKTKRYFAAD